ncbi:MAG: 50S ribosomal protein L11 methyltransferase [Verrucomicrobiales bacterium]|nr:50S ribosomal protein L11 methyltransferase [Verrucomicrobiales bacterium]
MKTSELLRQISITVAPEAEEDVAELLREEFGQPPSSHLDLATGLCTVSVYWGLPASEIPAARASLREGLKDLVLGGLDIRPGRIGIRKVPPRDWSESWKRHFRPIEVGRTLLVQPTWSRRKPKAGQALVLLDPGLSFGTGQHATTRYCLERITQLRRPGSPQSMLDAGSGSGILAIAAAKLGYSPVAAFDYDAEAVRISRTNCRLNGVEGQVQPELKDLTKMPRKTGERFDVVCANLICDLLVAEHGRLLARLKPRGSLVVAGILESQFPEVERALTASGLRKRGARTEGEWRSGWFEAP